MSELDDWFGPGTADQLRDILELCRRCSALADRGKAWYDSDPELEVPKLAADALVLKLGEAVRRLPSTFLDARGSEPQWRRAIGMRKRLAHECDAVDYDMVWRVVSIHAAELGRQITAILGDT